MKGEAEKMERGNGTLLTSRVSPLRWRGCEDWHRWTFSLVFMEKLAAGVDDCFV